MEYAVDGHDVDPSELNDGSWTLALDMQKKYRRPTGTASSPINGATTLTRYPPPKTRRQRPGNPNLRNAPELTTGAGQTPFHPCEAGARAEETGRSRDHGETARVRAEETDRLLDLGKTARHPARGGDRSRSSHKQATSKGSKPAQQPRAKKSPQDSQ
ncbi:hypothetical protein MTO96_039835, partial [Rhipicephalus appendiculatus]